MQDHPDISSAPPHGLRPETWAVAEYDGLREAVDSVLARVIALEYHLERDVFGGPTTDVETISAATALNEDLVKWHREGVAVLRAKFDVGSLNGFIARAVQALSDLEPRTDRLVRNMPPSKDRKQIAVSE
jgi:hypothetical protein